MTRSHKRSVEFHLNKIEIKGKIYEYNHYLEFDKKQKIGIDRNIPNTPEKPKKGILKVPTLVSSTESKSRKKKVII